MLKRCHKCQKVYDTQEYFCDDCGTVLYDEKEPEKNKQTEVPKSDVKVEKPNEDVSQKTQETARISKESDQLINQMTLLRKYVTGGTFRVCTVMIIAAVAIASVFEAFMQFATYTMNGEKLTLYIASHIAFTLALSAFYALLPAISMNKLSGEAENYVVGNDGAFVWKANKALTYITAYFLLQTVITGCAVGFVFNASMISVISGEPGIAVMLSVVGVFAAAVTLPYFISGLVTFLVAKGNLKKAVPITGSGAKLFGICFMAVSILSTVILTFAAMIMAVVKVADASFLGTAPIMNLFSKMSGTYLIYIFIMLVRSVSDIVIASGFLSFINKLKKVK